MPITTTSGDRVTLDGSSAEINTPKLHLVLQVDELDALQSDLYRVELHGMDSTGEDRISVVAREYDEATLVGFEAGFAAAWATVVSAFTQAEKDHLETLNPSATFTIV